MTSALPEAPGHLIGRETELARLQELLGGLPDQGGSLSFVGGPGSGKTALLQWTAQVASKGGLRVLEAQGVESEQALGFAGLSQLLLPVWNLTQRLPRDLRDALSAGVGLADGVEVAPQAVGHALRELIRQVREPLLIVVDDLQWVDLPTVEALASWVVADARPGVAVLTARRPGAQTVDPPGTPEHLLAPLDEALARSFIRQANPGISDSVLTSLVALADGNPLALVELPAALTEAELRGYGIAPDAVPLSPRVQRLYADRLLALPSETRRLVLMAALSDGPDLPLLGGDLARGALAAAEEAGLIRLEAATGRVRFRHPLVRSIAITHSTSAARRAAHLAWTERLEPDDERYAWHRAATSTGPDERVAGRLDTAASDALKRGDASRALRAHLLAADLSSALDARARRLADAAYVGAQVLGSLGRASDLLDEARRAHPTTLTTVSGATAAAYVLMTGSGEVDTAQRVLTPALALASTSGLEERHAVEEALHNFLDLCIYASDEAMWSKFHAAAQGFDLEAFPLLQLRIEALADPIRTAAAALPRLEDAIARLADEPDATYVGRVAMTAFFVDRVDQARQPLVRLVKEARAGRAVGPGIRALGLLSTHCLKAGHWDEAERWAEEGLRLCEEGGNTLYAAPFRFCLAMVSAVHGDAAATNRLCTELLNWARPRRVQLAPVYAAHARTVLALGAGEFEQAYSEATSVCEAGTFPPHFGWAIWMALDVVEAAVLAQRPRQAEAHVRAMQSHNFGDLSSRARLVLAGAEAMVAQPLRQDLFERALTGPDAGRWPFELARIELRYGQALRRARLASEARRHLEQALRIFEGLSAPAWADQARAEILAASPTKPPPAAWPGAALTPRERAIARLAAKGLTNKAIATRLQISPRTVAAHLHHIFAKLGIRTRAALSHDVAQWDDEGSAIDGGLAWADRGRGTRAEQDPD